ncbi:MAG TPA: type II secretion system F family protein, partial [Candidatus Solibacter sp.]|nr:type II secretion system F family protein [Candidatus Solibacter sp.]
SACAFLMLMLLISWVGYRLIYKPGRFLRQLGQPVITSDARRVLDANSEPEASTLVTVLHQIGSRVPSSDAEVANLKADLIRGGFRSENALPVFYGIRIVSTLTMLALCFMLEARMPDNIVMKLGLMASGIGAGWILPRFFLEKKVTKRKEVLRLSLPDALDLLVVSVEAGLGLDQAIQHVARELHASHPELSEEMSLVTLEMRAGKRRSEALRNFAERTGEPEFRKLVAILIQNDRFGTSMGESLRTHSDFLRTRRRQEAEERAGTVGVKLVFPIFFFILPSMLIVAAGPGLLQIFKYLFPMMKKLG